MKKVFNEKVGLSVNVFSWLALMLLLLGAYVFRTDTQYDERDKTEEKQETIQKKSAVDSHSTVQIKTKKIAAWDDPSVKKPGILLDQFEKY